MIGPAISVAHRSLFKRWSKTATMMRSIYLNPAATQDYRFNASFEMFAVGFEIGSKQRWVAVNFPLSVGVHDE